MTVPSRPTIVAIFAIARMSASRKLRSGTISSSITLAIDRRMAATPCGCVSSPAGNSFFAITPFCERLNARAASGPCSSSTFWNRGRNALRSVLASRLSRIRQMTSVTAVNDIRNIGAAKYHSDVTKCMNADDLHLRHKHFSLYDS